MSEQGFFLKCGVISLALHCILLAIMIFGLRYSFPRGPAGVYTVSIRPMFSPGGGPGGGASIKPANPPAPPRPASATPEKTTKEKSGKEITSLPEKKAKTKELISPPSEKSEPIGPRKEESTEGLKPSRGKKETEEKYSPADLQKALDEIRRQSAIERIRNRVDRRDSAETRPGDPASRAASSAKIGSPGQTASADRSIAGTGPGGAGIPGAETGGSGTGIGGTGGPGSIFGFGSGGTKLEEYYGILWSRVKQEWTIPGNVILKKDELETIVVLVIDKQGKVQKTWFEKKSGNTLYDQSAMRAIKKAEPFPPLPKELGEDLFELALRFTPD